MSLTVAIPTWNNTHQLIDTLVSMVRNTDFAGRVLVINNGEPGSYETVQGAVPYDIDWVDAGKNLGWCGGINKALEYADTDFFTMLNDDVLFTPASTSFWSNTLGWFDHPDTGGVGPSSNYVAGVQSAFAHIGHPVVATQYLIGFCATYRTKILKDLGGLDEALPGGDDLDLSIRVRGKGLNLYADRRNFLFHHGGQTGQRVHPGFWDSPVHQADTYNALIRKHGLREWYKCVSGEYADWPSFCIERHAVRQTRTAMMSCTTSVDGLYAKSVTEPSDVRGHIEPLMRFASGCKVICESGVADCTTTAAFLKALPDELHCFDIKRQPNVDLVEKAAEEAGIKFTFHHGSILDADFPECDMWWIDDLHTYSHVKAELEAHAHKVRKYVAFHDTEMCLEQGEDASKPGIWAAISEYMREHPEWRLVYTTENFAGMALFARVA